MTTRLPKWIGTLAILALIAGCVEDKLIAKPTLAVIQGQETDTDTCAYRDGDPWGEHPTYRIDDASEFDGAINDTSTIENHLLITALEGVDNLQQLSHLREIGGNLEISNNPDLETLDGLQCLNLIGGHIIIRGNGKLKDLDGLESIASTTSLIIQDNEHLDNMDGLENLKKINGNLEILGNNSLKLLSLKGLESSIEGDLFIAGNDNLSYLDLNNLRQIHGDMSIGIRAFYPKVGNAKLGSLRGLETIQTIGGDVRVSGNSLLDDLRGLDGLSEIHGSLTISSNSRLVSLAGLSQLNSINGVLSIYANSSLRKLRGEGLDSLNDVKGTWIWSPQDRFSFFIVENSALPQCEPENLASDMGINFPEDLGTKAWIWNNDGTGTCE